MFRSCSVIPHRLPPPINASTSHAECIFEIKVTISPKSIASGNTYTLRHKCRHCTSSYITCPKTIHHANFKVHLKSSRGSTSTLKFAKFPEPPSFRSKLQNCGTELIACSFESSRRDKDTSNVPKWSILDTFKIIHENKMSAKAILVFFRISQSV